MAQKPCGMHVEDIKSALRQQYGSLGSICKQSGLNPSAISATLFRPSYSIKTERRIAQLLGMKPRELFPDRFHVDGSPISYVVDRKPTRGIQTSLRQNGVRHGSGEEGTPKCILVAAGHRFRAAELAEWTDINASNSKLNADEARLKEIDENLLRPETQRGSMKKADQIATVATCSIPRLAVDADASLGVSERTVHGYISLYRALQPETVKAL